MVTRKAITAGMLSSIPALLLASTSFLPPEPVSAGSALYHLSRNPNHCMAFDSAGRLHLAYWSGSFAASATDPSHIYYRSWSPASGWTAPVSIDDSTADEGSGPVHIGGRHPSLAIAQNDDVWVTWHDHRHTSSVLNNINNLEIYADRMPAAGSFSSTDIRISFTSNTSISGDNGYLPRVAIGPTGVVSILWYDFTRGTGRNADIYAKHSNALGVFNDADSMESLRLTNAEPLGANFAYSTPDMAADASGNLFAVWTSGFGGAAPTYYSVVPNPSAAVAPLEIRGATGGYDEPSHVTVAPNGDVWVTFTDRSGATRDVRTMRRAAGGSTFDAAIDLAASASVNERHGDLEVAADGTLHAVWIDERDATPAIYYGRFAPMTHALAEEVRLTPASANFTRPELALDAGGTPYIVFEEQVDAATGVIWFVRTVSSSAAHGWENYK